MLPAIAATAITRYSEPGDLVADPICGIGTTLVEAIHLGRDAIGTEYEPRWTRRDASAASGPVAPPARLPESEISAVPGTRAALRAPGCGPAPCAPGSRPGMRGGPCRADGRSRGNTRRCRDGGGVEIDPLARAEVSVVLFQFGQHAHGEGEGLPDPLGPGAGVLPVPRRDRDQEPAQDHPRPDTSSSRGSCPRTGGTPTAAMSWFTWPASPGTWGRRGSAPGGPSTAVISSHSPWPAGRCPARYSTSTSSSRSPSPGKPGTSPGRPGLAGPPGICGCGPAGPVAGALSTVSHVQGC
jgi:hypothetical protein